MNIPMLAIALSLLFGTLNSNLWANKKHSKPSQSLQEKKAPQQKTAQELQKNLAEDAAQALNEVSASITAAGLKATALTESIPATVESSKALVAKLQKQEGKKKSLTLLDPAYIDASNNAAMTDGYAYGLQDSLQEVLYDVENAIKCYKKLLQQTASKQ